MTRAPRRRWRLGLIRLEALGFRWFRGVGIFGGALFLALQLLIEAPVDVDHGEKCGVRS